MKKLSSTITGLLILAIFLISCEEKKENTSPSSNEIIEEVPLPSWNERETKLAIINYVQDVTNPESDNFINVADRIATFDNDGTLWAEQPAYFQLFFAMDRVKALAPEHPEWNTTQPFKAVLENEMEALRKLGMQEIVEILMTTHVGSTTEEFESIVKSWIKTAKHPTKNVSYDKLVYQPTVGVVRLFKSQ